MSTPATVATRRVNSLTTPGPNRLETGGAATEHKCIGREGHQKVSGESLDVGAMAAQNAQSEIVEPDAAPPLRLWRYRGPSAT